MEPAPPLAVWFLGSYSPLLPAVVHAKAPADASPGQREIERERDSPGGHGPWAGSGHVALGKDRPAHLPSAGPEQQPHAREKFLCSLGLY